MIPKRNCLLAIVLIISQIMPAMGKRLPVVSPEKVGLSPTLLLRADSIIQHAVSEGDIPGAVLAVVRHDKIGYLSWCATTR